ncbi:MAG: hypothetical protein R2867_24455 [Caldilineaceae bacterium]
MTAQHSRLLVRLALHDDTATVLAWTAEPLAGGFSGSAVYRFQARRRPHKVGVPVIWCGDTPANGTLALTDDDYWKRDVLFHQSGLLDTLPETLVAPRCFRIDEASIKPVGFGSKIWVHRSRACNGRSSNMASRLVIWATSTAPT